METTFPLALGLRAKGHARWLRRAAGAAAILAGLAVLRLTVLRLRFP